MHELLLAAALLFHNVQVFDGQRSLGRQDVLVQEGKIAGIGKLKVSGATVIDGTGKTLLPGLIDSHTHTWGDALPTALAFGVTTELDMFTDAGFLRQMKEEQASGKANDRADLFSAGVLVTAPGGHGTEYGVEIPTITRPDEAQAFVDARIAEGSDYIKIVYDDGSTYQRPFATLSKETLRAVVVAAHARKKLAVVHIGDLAGARAAIDAGADALVHLFVDRDPDAAFGRDVARRHAFVVPTMTVLMSVTGIGGGAVLADDPRFVPYLAAADRERLRQGFPRTAGQPPLHYDAAEATVRQLRSAKVSILAGTDAGNPGTAHGSALHRELELLVKAGLTPAEALQAATSAPAKAFGLEDRGRIAIGKRADLLLVDGDPARDITATRNIAGIWKNGVAFDRAAFAKRTAEANERYLAKPAVTSGDISNFDDGTTGAKFGAGWIVSTDSIAGGKSTASMAVADGVLVATGTIDAALPYAWAGPLFMPGKQMFQPADLSHRKTIRFRARGGGKTYRLMVFTAGTGPRPIIQTFVAGTEWTEHAIPFSAFNNIDGHDVTGILWAAGPEPGEFQLQLDDIRLE